MQLAIQQNSMFVGVRPGAVVPVAEMDSEMTTDLPQSRELIPVKGAASQPESAFPLAATWQQEADGTLVCAWGTSASSAAEQVAGEPSVISPSSTTFVTKKKSTLAQLLSWVFVSI